jgi:uncharacterized protein YaiI (UPF0178 family)
VLDIFVDADACPVKQEVERVADRHGLTVYMVSNGGIRPSAHPRFHHVTVADGADAADDWIAERIGMFDIAVTADVPLASRCLKKNASVIGRQIVYRRHDRLGARHARAAPASQGSDWRADAPLGVHETGSLAVSRRA